MSLGLTRALRLARRRTERVRGWLVFALATLGLGCSSPQGMLDPESGATAGAGAAGGGTGGGQVSSGAGGQVSSGAGGQGGSGSGITRVIRYPIVVPLPGHTRCEVVETTNIPEPHFQHLDPCTPIAYATNPPSGGDHWPIWLHYAAYTSPVPREQYVHNLEHGAVVLAYSCDGCDDVVAAFEAIRASLSDPLCVQPGPTARVVITPDPLLDTPIAIAAWGATYTASCIDTPSMAAFVASVYGHGREDLCADGSDPIVCPDAGAP